MKNYLNETLPNGSYWLLNFSTNTEKTEVCICLSNDSDSVNIKHEIVFSPIKFLSIKFNASEVEANYIPTVLGFFWNGTDKYMFATDTFEVEFCSTVKPKVITMS